MGVRRAACVGVLLGGALGACGDPPEHEVIADRVAEGIPEATVDDVADAVGLPDDLSLFEEAVERIAVAFGSKARPAFTPRPPLAPALAAAGDRWPEALLAGLVRAKGEPCVVWTTLILGDEGGHPGAVELRARPEGRLDAELLALVLADTTASELWSFALSNLVRPESASVRDDLVEYVLDSRHDQSRRRQVLLRLVQLEAGVPERIDDLLYLPGGGMDHVAATVAAIGGRPVSISLVVDLAERMASSKFEPAIPDGHSLVELVAHAALVLCPDDADAVAAARGFLGDESTPFADPVVAQAADQSLRRAVAAGLRRLMESSPELSDTPFESDRRLARERAEALVAAAPESMSELAGLADDQIDLATAALSVYGRPHVATAESFERMMILLERDVRAASGPDAIVGALRARLCGPTRRMSGVGHNGLASDLAAVMYLQCGNSVGGSVLWTAVADRLELPIRPVSFPGHVAVVWDDGTRRMILETTQFAEERNPEFYREFEPLADLQDAPAAQVLRPLSETGLLACLLSNTGLSSVAPWLRVTDDSRRAGLADAELALVLDADNRRAVAVAATLGAQLDQIARDRTLERLDAIAKSSAHSSLERLGFAEAYLACNEAAKADAQLRLVEERHAADPRVAALRAKIGR